MWAIRAETYTYAWMDMNNDHLLHKHYHDKHGKVPEDLLTRFDVLKKCKNKFDS